jgi:hypothetical protein
MVGFLQIQRWYWENQADHNFFRTTYGTEKNFPGSSWAWRVPTLVQVRIWWKGYILPSWSANTLYSAFYQQS